MLSADYWNNRYLNDETGWDIGYASPAILDFFRDKNKDARILIPGCGNAYEGELLHKNGFQNIMLADFAMETKKNFLDRCTDFNTEHFLVGDFFKLEGKYDFIVEQTFFCALMPPLRESYVLKIKDLLGEDGKLVGLLFDVPLNTEHPPFGGSKEEYLELFCKYFNHVKIEKCNHSIPPRAGKELWIEISH